MPDQRQVVIVGSGPAGLTAAIYSARAQLHPLVVAGEPSSTSDQPGGQLMLTTEVENFPGFPNGVMGPDLMDAMRQQAERFGAEFVTAKVHKVDLSERPFAIFTDPESTEPDYYTQTLIIATGARSLMLDVPGESRLLGHGVSTCATCDGFFFTGLPIAVVGGGDSAIEEALFLTRFGESVTLIHRRDQLRASKIMQERAFANPKLSFLWNTVVEEVVGEESLSHLVLRNVLDDSRSELKVSGLFVAIGHVPNTDPFLEWLDHDDRGYLLARDGTTHTNIDGVFVCGDVQDSRYRQAITAAGSGCAAAIDAERWLEAHTSHSQA